jgi:hypothetical protein
VKDKDGNRNGNPDQSQPGKRNREVVVFIFFLFLSFGLWYINSLGKEAEADIWYPFRYVNIPKDRAIADITPSRLIFSLKGPGYTLLKLRMSGDRPPVTIDLAKVSYKRLPDGRNNDYFINTSALLKSLTVQIRTGCEIIAIKPDTLFFNMNRTGSKTVSDPKQ